MPKCWKCHKKIAYIFREEKAFVGSVLLLNHAGNPEKIEVSFETDVVDFKCPRCRETIADFEEDAVKILKGEKV